MAHVSYPGLGSREAAVSEFDSLLPHVKFIRELQDRCWPSSPEERALEIAVDGLETAAFHFTRRPHYYDTTRNPREHGRNFYPGLEGDEAVAAFAALQPYSRALKDLQHKCRPFGRDYLALEIARHCLETAAYHFTRDERFYAAKSDSARPVRPPSGSHPQS